jgi:hypothetical protein
VPVSRRVRCGSLPAGRCAAQLFGEAQRRSSPQLETGRGASAAPHAAESRFSRRSRHAPACVSALRSVSDDAAQRDAGAARLRLLAAQPLLFSLQH